MKEKKIEDKKGSKPSIENVQINEGVPFGQGNYGKLMEKLLATNG